MRKINLTNLLLFFFVFLGGAGINCEGFIPNGLVDKALCVGVSSDSVTSILSKSILIAEIEELEQSVDDILHGENADSQTFMQKHRYVSGVVLVLLGVMAILLWDWNKALVERIRYRTQQLSASQQELEESRAMLKNVLNTVPARVYWKGMDGNFLGCNKAFADDAALDAPERIEGKSDYELMWKERAAMYRQDDFRVMDTGTELLDYEEFQLGSHGERVLLSSKVPLRDRTGEVIGVLGSYTDITEHKQAETHLRQLNSILRTMRSVNQLIAQEKDAFRLMKQATDLLVKDREMSHAWSLLLDEEGLVTNYFEAISGGGAGILDDEAVFDGRMPRCIKSALETSGLVLSPMDVVGCKGCLSEKSCKKNNTMTISYPLAYNHRKFGVMLGVATEGVLRENEEIKLFKEICDDLAFALYSIDLEFQKSQSFMEMMKAKEQAEIASKAKDEFLTVMSHEMRTPLNPIMGFANLLREEGVKEPERTYLDTIINSAQRQLDLVDSILDFGKLEAGTLKPRMVNFNLLEVCQRAIAGVEYAAHGLNIEFRNGDHDLQPIPNEMAVNGEKTMLSQILDNLLNNACKYTTEGFVKLVAGMKVSAAGKPVYQFRVEDSGIGISEAQSRTLFAPFTQVDSSSTRRYEGVGLGLAVCRKLIDLLGGDIGLVSELGKGSVFWFELSMAQVKGFKPKKEKSTPKDCKFKRPFHVLLVEDNKANVMIVQRLIEKFGGNTTVAVNGRQGVELCKKEHFDAVLMDLCMPVMNGFDATRAIVTGENQNKKTPIIALTADLSNDVRERCLDAGMVKYLTKPIRIQKLFETLNDVSEYKQRV